MEQYISKSALVAEIERRIEKNKADIQRATHKHLEEYFEGYEDALVLFKEKFLDTIEVKEVDLEKEINEQALFYDYALVGMKEIKVMAKHFFALGIKAQK